MRDVVGGGAVEAAVAVDRGVDVEAAAEGAGGVGGPLVEVAHEIVEAVGGDAAGVRTGAGEAVGELVQAGVADHREHRAVARLEVLHGGVAGARVVAHAGHAGRAVGIGGGARALARAQPLGVGAQPLAGGDARGGGLGLVDMTLRHQARRADGADRGGAGAPVRRHAAPVERDQRGLPAIDARCASGRHAGGAAAEAGRLDDGAVDVRGVAGLAHRDRVGEAGGRARRVERERVRAGARVVAVGVDRDPPAAGGEVDHQRRVVAGETVARGGGGGGGAQDVEIDVDAGHRGGDRERHHGRRREVEAIHHLGAALVDGRRAVVALGAALGRTGGVAGDRRRHGGDHDRSRPGAVDRGSGVGIGGIVVGARVDRHAVVATARRQRERDQQCALHCVGGLTVPSPWAPRS